MERSELDKRFDYHAPKDDETRAAHETIRQVAKAHAAAVLQLVPVGREQSLAITAIEEAMMWANAGIARAGGPNPDAVAALRAQKGEEFGAAV